MEEKETTPEVTKVNVIEESLAKQNVTKQVIAKLKADYSGLKINGIDDLEGFKKVEEARKECKAVRVLATKICKVGREAAIQEQKDWIAKEKEVVGEVSEIEDELEAESDRIKELQKKILFEAAQKEKLPVRKDKLMTIGVEVADEELLKISDEEFMTLFNELHSKVLEEKAEAMKKQEAEKQAEVDRIEKEKKDLFEKRQAEINPIAKYFDECSANGNFLTLETTEEQFQELIKHCTDNKEKFEKEKAEKDAEIERLNAEAEKNAMIISRQNALYNLGFKLSEDENQFKTKDLSVTLTDIETLSGPKWAAHIADITKQLNEIKLAQEKVEAERQETIKKMEALQKKRFDEIMPYNNPVKNKIDLAKLWELSDDDYQRIFSNKKADWEKAQAEIKVTAEKAAAAQKELADKKAAEEKAEADKQAKIEADLAMGDKGKMTGMLAELVDLKVKYEFKSAKHKKLQAEVNGLIDKIVDYATPKN